MLKLPKTDIDRIGEIFQQEGYLPTNNLDHLLRYDLIKEPDLTIILGAKLPIIAPITHSPPVELVAFYISLIFRPLRFDEQLIRFIAASFREIVNKIPSYAHDFNLTKYRSQIDSIVAKYYPDETNVDPSVLTVEYKLNSFIRDKTLKDIDNLEPNSLLLSQDILDIYRDFNLTPTNELPSDLQKGLPRGRENITVLFQNNDFGDYLIEEPGCFNYWRDFQQKNFWIRAGVQSVTPWIWYLAFADQQYRMNYLYYDWIIYSRAMIKALVGMIDNEQFQLQNNQSNANMQAFNLGQYLKDVLVKQIPVGIFLPALTFESQFSPELIAPNYSIFESAPRSLEELLTIYNINRAKVFLQKGNYSQAKQLLMDALSRLKKFHHTFGQVKLLLRLNDLFMAEEKYSEAIQIQAEALQLCQTGKIPVTDIVDVHIALGRAYALSNDLEKSVKEFEITLNFLRSLPASEDITVLIPKTYLELARLSMQFKHFETADKYFKEIAKYVKNFPIYDFYYNYERANYYAGVENEAKQIASLEKAISTKESSLLENIKAHLTLGKVMVYNKKDAKQSLDYLLNAEKLNTSVDVEFLKLKIQTYEVLFDVYTALKDDDSASNAKQEVKKLQEKLDRLN